METASDVAPAASRILEALADVADEVVGLNEASRLTGLWPGALRAAIEHEDLDATFGRVAPTKGNGRTGNPYKWQIVTDDLRAFIARCPTCARAGCDQLGLDPTGYCRVHARAERQRGVARPEIGPKISAARSGVTRGPHSNERRRNIREGLRRFWSSSVSAAERERRRQRAMDPHWQWEHFVARWLPRTSVGRIVELYRRRFGEAPPRSLVGKWSFKIGGGRPRNDSRSDYDELLESIRAEYAATHETERALAERLDVSRRLVRTALGRPV